jgi:DNA-directed RNA polymerase subunit H
MEAFIELDEIVVTDSIINYFYKYHGLVSSQAFTKDELITQFSSYGYLLLNALNTVSNKYTYICIVSKSSSHLVKKSNIVTFLNSIKLTLEPINELIFIIDNISNSKKNIKSVLLEFNYKGFDNVFVYPYSNFIIPIPYHEAVPKHEIVTKKEFEQFLKLEKVSAGNIFTISVNDPPCIWLRAKKDDAIKITRISNTVCVAIEYRIVK